MTSDTCNCTPISAAPTPNSRPSKPRGTTGRGRRARPKNRRSRRATDRAATLAFRRPIPDRLYDDARRKGFVLIGRGRRSADMMLQCVTCRQLQQVRRSVLINNALECKNCLWMRRFDDAMASGATILLPDPCSHKIAMIALSCGHIVQRQYGRLARAARGGHALGCETCREAHYVAQADGSGWDLAGPPCSGKIGYRRYRHHCGHCQDHAIVNVDNRQVDCANCGESWVSKPSCIYLFQIELIDRAVLKFGYSANPKRRLRYQLGDAARLTGRILRVIDLKTGHAAMTAELQGHRFLHQNHADFVVDAVVFGGQIKSKSEIYDLSAEHVINKLMDRIADATSDDSVPVPPLSKKKAKVR